MNKVISWKTDEHFTDGKEYECSYIYNNMVDVLGNDGKLIHVGIEDTDFTFLFNVRTCDGCNHYGDFYKPECRECRISGKGIRNNYVKKKFKVGDKVYHNGLRLYGSFVGYARETEEECDVDFFMDDNEVEQRHVTVARLKLVDKK